MIKNFTTDQKIAFIGLLGTLISAMPIAISFIKKLSFKALYEFFSFSILLSEQNIFLICPILIIFVLFFVFWFDFKLFLITRVIMILLIPINIYFTNSYLRSDLFVCSYYYNILELEDQGELSKAYEYSLIGNKINPRSLNYTKRRLSNKLEVANSVKRQLENCYPKAHGYICEELEVMLNAIGPK